MVNNKKSKRGVSIMIGYILLVSLAVVMGGVMYVWMKSYVPQEEIACPEGVSLTVPSYSYNCSTQILNLSIRNNGRFDVAGYYIKAAIDPNQRIATKDLTKKIIKVGEMYVYYNAIIFGSATDNQFGVGNSTFNLFNLAGETVNIQRIEITPVRWQKDEKNRLRFAGCGEDSTLKEIIQCDS
jgi:hypothetical protein